MNQFRIPAGPEEARKVTNDQLTPIDSLAPVSCPTCGIQLKHRKNLNAHMAIHVGDKPFQCPDCPKTFLRSNQLKSHSMVHTGERPHMCEICSRSFAQLSNYKAHLRVHEMQQQSFSCRHCCKRFGSQPELDDHHAYHVGPDQFRCPDCGKTYARLPSLRYHRLTHSLERPFVCRACGKSFIHSSVLSVHMRTHTGAKPYKCEQCDRRFAQWTNFNRHRTQVHSRNRSDSRSQRKQPMSAIVKKDGLEESTTSTFRCPDCGKQFRTQRRFGAHRQMHRGQCEVCGAEFVANDERSYRQHMRLHAWKVWCDICDGGFQSLRAIREHMRLEHAGSPVYECAVCPDVELSDLQLADHVRREHGGGGGEYEWHACPFCERRFVHRGVLLGHLRDHEGELQNELQCSECGIVFRRFAYYKKHRCVKAQQKRLTPPPDPMECPSSYESAANQPVIADVVELATNPVHSETFDDDPPAECPDETMLLPTLPQTALASPPTPIEPPPAPFSAPGLPCTVCAKLLRTPKALRMHQQTHGPKRFQCEYCAMRFVRRSQLETHRRTHTGDRPYRCSRCPRRFAQACMVTVHERTHTGQRPFECPQCARRFAQTANLRRHQLTHSNARPWSCRACGRAFQRKHAMLAHERRHESAALPDAAPAPATAVAAESSVRTQHRVPPLVGDEMAPDLPPIADGGLVASHKPHCCAECGKRFAQLSVLLVHRRVHTGEKPYKCEQCPKTFRQWCHLNRHRSVHSGCKPFVCGQCDRGFARLQTLQTHQRSHGRQGREGIGMGMGDGVDRERGAEEEEEVVEGMWAGGMSGVTAGKDPVTEGLVVIGSECE